MKIEPVEVCTSAMLEPEAGEASMHPVLRGLVLWRWVCDPHRGSWGWGGEHVCMFCYMTWAWEVSTCVYSAIWPESKEYELTEHHTKWPSAGEVTIRTMLREPESILLTTSLGRTLKCKWHHWVNFLKKRTGERETH